MPVPSTDMARLGLPLRFALSRAVSHYSLTAHTRILFLDDAHADLGAHVGVQLDPDLEVAQLADRLGEVHLALVDVDPQLFQLALDVARGDRAVQLVLLADLRE